jgi:beta-lactamase class A
MKKLSLLLLAATAFSCTNPSPETKKTEKEQAANGLDSLRVKLEGIVKSKNADIGVGIIALDSGDTLSIHGNKAYIMMSTAKFPQALYVLNQVDKGTLKLSQQGTFTKEEIDFQTYSPVRDSINKPSGYSLTVADLLLYSVGKSDNLSFDKLFQVAGKPQVVTNYLQGPLGLGDMKITTGYAQMREDNLEANQCTPNAMALALKKFYSDKILSDSSHAFLWKIMTETQSGPNRIKGQLPKETIVAHKTGTMYRNEDSIMAYNDVGIVEAKRPFAIAIFVNNSYIKEPATAQAIAEIAKAAFDYFMREE